jgi:hypothetical protein
MTTDQAIELAETTSAQIGQLLDAAEPQAAAGHVDAAVAEFREYAAHSGADLWRAGQDLVSLASRLARAGLATEALATQRAAVDVLRAFAAPPELSVEYTITFAEARHNLIAWLLDAGEVEPAASIASETVSGYLEYAAAPGASIERAVKDLEELAKQLSGALLPIEALRAQQAVVDLLAGLTSGAGGDDIRFVEAQHNLIARLLDADQAEPAADLVNATLAGYRGLAVAAGADLGRIGRDLRELVSTLEVAGLSAGAAQARQLADEIAGGGAVAVRATPESMTVAQGAQATINLEIVPVGDAKQLTVRGGDLPRGVRIETVTFAVGPGEVTHIQPVRLSVDANAPTRTAAFMPLLWAVDSALPVLLNVPLTIDRTPASRTFSRVFETPSGTALGGTAELVLNNDGTYVFRGHMHNRHGFDPYAFRVNYFLQSADRNLALADVFTSRVGGTLGGGPRDRYWNHDAQNDLIREYWDGISASEVVFSIDYEDTGVIGALEDIAAFAAEFLLLRVLGGPAFAATVMLGPELLHTLQIPATVPQSIPGAVVVGAAGGAILLWGPLAAVPVVIAGDAIAALDGVKTRRMRPTEIAEARRVFQDTIPYADVRVTNLVKRSDGVDTANFCHYNELDSTFIIGMGDRFDADLVGDPVFIHELTHVWQHVHSSFSLASLWHETFEKPFQTEAENAEEYRIFFDERPWHDFEAEGQAVAVALWFAAEIGRTALDAADKNILFRYIVENIRLGVP